MRIRSTSWLVVFAPFVACSTGTPLTRDQGQIQDRDAAVGDIAGTEIGLDGSSDLEQGRTLKVTLLVTGYGREVSQLYVPIRYNGDQALLLLDTGAATSFLHLPLISTNGSQYSLGKDWPLRYTLIRQLGSLAILWYKASLRESMSPLSNLDRSKSFIQNISLDFPRKR